MGSWRQKASVVMHSQHQISMGWVPRSCFCCQVTQDVCTYFHPQPEDVSSWPCPAHKCHWPVRAWVAKMLQLCMHLLVLKAQTLHISRV